MAKKKEPTIEDALKVFLDVIGRASLNPSYQQVNSVLLSTNDKDNKILVIPDKTLLQSILNIDTISIRELDVTNGEDIRGYFECGEDLVTDWISIDMIEDLFKGKIFSIKIKDREYKIPINRDLMPLKLKKAECDNISYKVFNNPLILAIRKRFDSTVDDCGFDIIRLFRII